MAISESNPYAAAELLDERNCSWNEREVPQAERGVSFKWLSEFVASILWEKNAPVRRNIELRKVKYEWEKRDIYYPQDPLPDYFDNISTSTTYDFDYFDVHEFVAKYVIPATQNLRCPLYALVPPSERGKPEVFLSHAWTNMLLSPVPQWHGGTLDAFESRGIVGVKERFVWIDFVSYNQHEVSPDSIAFDMESIIRSIGNVAFAVTPTPLFDRMWCLWEVLSVSQTGATSRFCAGPSYRTDKRVMVNNFYNAFTSIAAAKSTKPDDQKKLLAAMVARFGSIAAANEHISTLMREEMGHPWFELAKPRNP